MMIRKAILFVALLSCLSSPSFAFGSPAPETYLLTEAELTILESNLKELEANNAKLRELLNESNGDLTIASDEQKKLAQELNAAKNQLSELVTLLNATRSDAESARKSLETANEELKKASESLKLSEREHKRTEKRLRTQRTFWEIVAGIIGGVAIAK